MANLLKNRFLLITTIIFCFWFFAHTTFILAEGFSDGLQNASGAIKNCDLAVVLGNKVEENGKPSNRLRARLDRAISLYQKGIVKNILMSGAKGKEGYEEAEIMRSYAFEKGVDRQKIIVDNQGYNSHQTALNTKKLLEENGFMCAVIVTHYYHISRTKLAFTLVFESYNNKQFLKKDIFGDKPKGLYYASVVSFELRDLYSICREFIGYYDYLFRRNI